MANSIFQSHKFRQVVSLLVAIVLIGAVSFLGVRMLRSSQAATGGTMTLTPSSTSVVSGTNVAVAVHADSGTVPVNAVQAGLTYDTSKLQFVSINEGSAYSVNAATDTRAGQVRVGRGTSGSSVTGSHVVVTVNFKVLASSGSVAVNLDRQVSAIVRSSDSQDILGTVTGATFTATSGGTADAQPTFHLTPSTGQYTNGSTVTVGINVKSPNAALFTVQPVFTYPADKLSFVNITEGTAFRTIGATRTPSGTINLTRGVSGGSSGVTGEHLIATITFRVIADGAATLSFTNVSGAYDGSGTGANVLNLGGSTGSAYTFSTTTNPGPGPGPGPNPNPNPVVQPPQPEPISGNDSQDTTTSNSGSIYFSGDSSEMSELENGDIEIQGEVALTPVVDTEILEQNPGDFVVKVEYYLGTELLARKTISPFTYAFDSKAHKNGTYDLIVKTYYNSGTVDTSTDKVVVANPVNLSYVVDHYASSLVSSLLGLVVVGFVLVRFALPRFKRASSGVVPSDDELFMGTDDTSGYTAPAGQVINPDSSNDLFAPAPTVIAPASSQQRSSVEQGYESYDSAQALPLNPVQSSQPSDVSQGQVVQPLSSTSPAGSVSQQTPRNIQITSPANPQVIRPQTPRPDSDRTQY